MWAYTPVVAARCYDTPTSCLVVISFSHSESELHVIIIVVDKVLESLRNLVLNIQIMLLTNATKRKSVSPYKI